MGVCTNRREKEKNKYDFRKLLFSYPKKHNAGERLVFSSSVKGPVDPNHKILQIQSKE